MRKFEFDGYTRINKTTARRYFDIGLPIVFCPVNLRPFTPWHVEIEQCKGGLRVDDNFDTFCNSFEYYNCNNSETGKYSAFYIRNNILIHMTFVDGSNPYIFKGTMGECYKELLKWMNNFELTFNSFNNGILHLEVTHETVELYNGDGYTW